MPPPWARIPLTVLGLAGIGVCVYFLFYAGPIAIAWFEHLAGDGATAPRYRALVTFVGVAATIGSLVLLVGLALIGWLLVQMWRPSRGTGGDR